MVDILTDYFGIIIWLVNGVLLAMVILTAALLGREKERRSGEAAKYNLPLLDLGYGLVLFDGKDRFVEANSAASQYLPFLGTKKNAPKHLKQFLNYLFDFSVECDDSLKKAIQKSGWSLSGADFREVIVWGNGRLCLAEIKTSGDGQTFLLLRDVSDLQKGERDVLRLSQYSFNMTEAVEAATNGIIMIDPAEQLPIIIFANDAFCSYLGADKVDIIGQNIHAVLFDFIDQETQMMISKAMQAGAQSNLEIKTTNPYLQRWFSVRLTPVRGGDDEANLYICVFTETTDLKQRESDMYQAQKLEALGKLTAGIAHDFNNILSIIEGYTGMIADKIKGQPEIENYTAKIFGSSERGSSLVRQMLMFGRQKIVSDDVIDFEEALKNQIEFVRPLIGASIEFDMKIECKDCYVKITKDALTQIIMNLCLNGCDAMPEGGRLSIGATRCHYEDMTPSVRTLAAEMGESFVCLSVKDSGCGMDKETRQKIFDPFFTTKQSGKGTGLGLSNVYGLVRQAGGYIDVQSRLGAGTAFLLYLPLIQKQPIKKVSGNLNDIKTIDLKGYTALVAEDEHDLLFLVSDMLEKLGMTVLRASNGNEALLKQDDYEGTVDLLLTDVVMPEMDGVKLGELLQSISPATRTIFMSGYPASGALAQVRLPDDAHFVAKPVNYEALVGLVLSVLSGEQDGGAAVRQPSHRWAIDQTH